MRTKHLFIFSSLACLGTLALFVLPLFNTTPHAIAAPIVPTYSSSAISAAPGVTHTLYLPLITKSCVNTQLLQDTGLETGLPNSYWRTTSTQASSVLDNSSLPNPNPTHGGSWKAWLGGNNLVQESLWQAATIPANTSALTLVFWRRIETNEPAPGTFDSLQIQVRDSVSATLQTAYTLYDLDATSTWIQQTIAISPTYSNQSIQIAFIAATDASSPTNFFVDDVTLTACH